MPAEPLVYIIVVNWNGGGVTLECLDSLRSLTYGNHRILIVDNASTDGSAEVIRERFPDIELLAMDRNLLYAGGNNAGIRHALAQGARLILLLNNDTTVDAGLVSHLVERIQMDPTTGIVAPKIYYSSAPRTIWFAGGIISMWTGTMRHTGIRETDNHQHDLVREIDYATGCCLLIRKEVFESIGMLDESFTMYAEDADFSLRCRLAGFRIVYEPEAMLWHKLSISTGGHLSIYKLRRKFLGNFRFFARHAAWYHWLVFPWMNLVVNAADALRYITSTRRSGWN